MRIALAAVVLVLLLSALATQKVKEFKRQKKEAAKGPLPTCLSISVEGAVPSSEYEGRGGGMPRTKPKSGNQACRRKYSSTGWTLLMCVRKANIR